MSLKNKFADKKFLFLDRDGVINRRIVGGYVTTIEEFEFLEGVKDAIALLSKRFDKIFVVTNQQGVGKGIMSQTALNEVHNYMVKEIELSGGRIDWVFYCTDIAEKVKNCRKPGIKMGIMAKEMFPEINFKKSIMVGDSVSDMEFAENLGMTGVFINNETVKIIETVYEVKVPSLIDFVRTIM